MWMRGNFRLKLQNSLNLPHIEMRKGNRKKGYCLTKLAPLFIQSGRRSHAFSRQLHVIVSSFDWFTVFSMSFVIGYNDNFGFGFITLN